MPALKCPSPSCPFLFDPNLVPPGSVLTCPRCGMRFTLGPTSVPPQSQNPEESTYSSSPQQSYVPTESPTQQPMEGSAPPAKALVKRTAATERARQNAEPTSIKVKLALLAGGMLFLLMLGSIAIYFLLRGPTASSDSFGSELVVADKNFSFSKLPPGWELDNNTRNMMNLTAFVYRQTNGPEAWVALSVKDYDTANPFTSELRDKLVDHLSRGFDEVPTEFELKPTTWGGQPAQTTEFRLKLKGQDTPVYLIATFMTYRGFAYWCYTWAKQEDFDTVSLDLENLRNSFRVLNNRANRATPTQQVSTYRNSTGKYSLSNFERIWKEPTGLKGTDIDPKGDLFLKAELAKTGGRDLKPTAEILVMLLDDPGEAKDVGDQYIRERLRRNEADLGKVTLEELASEPTGDEPLGPPEPATPVTRLFLRRGTDKSFTTANKLIVYCAIRKGDKVVLVEGSCPWAEKDRWERRLIQLVGSVK
jgi:hypothetical protein